MVGASSDKGLSSSMWSPINTGRPPYSFNRKATTARSSLGSSLPSANLPASPNTPSRQKAALHAAASSTPGSSNSTGASTAHTTPESSVGGGSSSSSHLLVSALDRIPTPWAELGRFTKIARRLKWKLPFLAHGYNAAVHDPDHGQRAEAELMFKLDFFEYYMLLERALVHLMGVFGINITGGFARDKAGQEPTQSHRLGNGEGGSAIKSRSSDHRFHANVLEALDDARNPLHESLGKEEVRYALARAKELRNRWKNADDPDAALSTSAKTRPLADYDLERILETVFAGFDEGFLVAQQYVNEVRALAASRQRPDNGLNTSPGVNDMDMDMTEEEEGEWEFMTDAMDWQAV